MYFRFLHIRAEAGQCYLTGCFERCKAGTEEKELLDMLADCVNDANNAFKSAKIVLKDNTIFFRGIEADWLISALKYWDKCLGLSLTYRVGKNTAFVGDNAKKLFDKSVEKHGIKVEDFKWGT